MISQGIACVKSVSKTILSFSELRTNRWNGTELVESKEKIGCSSVDSARNYLPFTLSSLHLSEHICTMMRQLSNINC